MRLPKGYDAIRKEQLADYQKLFDRVSLDLGTKPEASLPTDQRVVAFPKSDDPALATLYFQYGRYLLIGSSRGGQPANLQGIWNSEINPPWGSKFTININTEMNYWHANNTNLGECVDPLLTMVEDMAVTGAKTAKVMYGARGWVAPASQLHLTPPGGPPGPIDSPGLGRNVAPCGAHGCANTLVRSL